MTPPVSVSVAGTVLLMGSLLLSQRCRGLRQTIKWQWQALSAGVAVSYVFVSVIPDLEEHRPTITASAAGSILDSEKRVYLFALAGFVAFVGLRRLRVRVTADTRGSPRSTRLGRNSRRPLHNVSQIDASFSPDYRAIETVIPSAT